MFRILSPHDFAVKFFADIWQGADYEQIFFDCRLVFVFFRCYITVILCFFIRLGIIRRADHDDRTY